MTEGRAGALAAVSQHHKHPPAGSICTYTELPTSALPALPVLGDPLHSGPTFPGWCGCGFAELHSQ